MDTRILVQQIMHKQFTEHSRINPLRAITGKFPQRLGKWVSWVKLTTI